tara:strand:- start:1701 stop:2321 length:621 start_codon:yes stop_codon:yes gene_type:complete
MIISHKHKCIFIRVPKCLSTSIEDFFIKLDPNCISSSNKIPYGHETARQVKQMVTKDEWYSYFKFTFFRNPEKRFISQYVDHSNYKMDFSNMNWLLTENSTLNKPEDKIIKKHDFSQFQVFSRWWNKPGFTYQQVDWQDEKLDFIGNMDKIKRDWNFIKEKIGINESLKLPHTNATNSKDWKLDYDSKLLLNIFYKDDLEFYDKLK